MAYLTFNEYRGMGGTLESAAFSLQEFRARKLLDQVTFQRVQTETPVREAVKYAMFGLILLQIEGDAQGGREMSSVSIDGLSVSYAQGQQETNISKRVKLVQEYLVNEVADDGIPLLYAGLAYEQG